MAHEFGPNSTGMLKAGAFATPIKPASPQLNGKVERSHRNDEQELYQFRAYTDGVDLRAKLS